MHNSLTLSLLRDKILTVILISKERFTMKKFFRTAAVLTLALMMGACASGEKTESDSAYIKDKGEMVIGITLFAPMNYYEGEELIGFETEFAQAVCEKIGVKPNFQEINWDAKEVELNSKNIDCIWNGMTITEERKTNMSVTKPYMANKQVMVTKAENLEKFCASIDGAAVVAEAGSAGETLVINNKYFANAQLTPADSMAKALMEVKAGTSDIAVVDYVASIGSIGEGTDFAELVVVPSEDFSPEEYGIAFRKGSDMTAEVDKAIDELKADGTLKEIADKYKLGDLLVE